MMFREKPINKLYAFALAAVFAIALAGCGGGGGTATTPPDDTPMPTPQEMCVADGGQWNADNNSCTTAAELQAAQRTAIMEAVTAARTAVGMVDDDATDAEVKAADDAVADLKAAIDGAVNLPEGDTDVASAEGTLATLEGQLASAKTSRMAAIAAKQTADDKAMMATASKLYKGLEHGLGNTDNIRTGASDADGVISVTIGTATAVALAEDKKTPVAANHGWAGKRHTAEPDDDGMYEAMVYSNVGAPTEGKKFGSAAAVTTDGDFEYQLTDGALAIDTSDAAVAGRVDSPSFDQPAGTKVFKKGANEVAKMISGSYHGVSGTYSCTPTTDTNACSATVAADGFTLGGGTWTFKPADPNAKVMSTSDTVYASYGWWIHKSEDGNTFTASAFATARGTVPAASGITNLRGTATYMGGAAGKYALYSSTGGTNDAGHFTARATLEADFNANMITGTIDNFMGADGEARNWSVELMKQGIGDTGIILGDDGAGTAGTDEKMTKWTIDGTAAAAAGQWSGALYDNDSTSGVPKVGTGTFHSTYSTSGRMVGAFGVNKQ